MIDHNAKRKSILTRKGTMTASSIKNPTSKGIAPTTTTHNNTPFVNYQNQTNYPLCTMDEKHIIKKGQILKREGYNYNPRYNSDNRAPHLFALEASKIIGRKQIMSTPIFFLHLPSFDTVCHESERYRMKDRDRLSTRIRAKQR